MLERHELGTIIDMLEDTLTDMEGEDADQIVKASIILLKRYKYNDK